MPTLCVEFYQHGLGRHTVTILLFLTFADYSKIQNKEITGFLFMMIKGNETSKLAGTSYAPAA